MPIIIYYNNSKIEINKTLLELYLLVGTNVLFLKITCFYSEENYDYYDKAVSASRKYSFLLTYILISMYRWAYNKNTFLIL